MKSTTALRALLLMLPLAVLSGSMPTEGPAERGGPTSRPAPDNTFQDTLELQERSRGPIATEEEISAIIEDLTGRRPSRRQVRQHREQAELNGWDAEAFANMYSASDEVRRLSPERVVEEAYREILGRSPGSKELRRGVQRLRYESWTPGRIRGELLNSDEYKEREADHLIDDAYHDLLDRRPDPDERRHYRREIIRNGFTEEDVRREIRKTQEFRVTRPNAIITAAFMEVLGRKPDLAGCEPFRKLILENGWTKDEFAAHVRKSPEYRSRVTELVTAAYREVLEREPDPSGLETYRKAMLERGWSEHDVRDHLRRSDEYKKRTRN